ncbi:MAG: N-acetylmuramic acid 6-phosphate etherase, partial [uncultured Thermomicrobiales bacterium]
DREHQDRRGRIAPGGSPRAGRPARGARWAGHRAGQPGHGRDRPPGPARVRAGDERGGRHGRGGRRRGAAAGRRGHRGHRRAAAPGRSPGLRRRRDVGPAGGARRGGVPADLRHPAGAGGRPDRRRPDRAGRGRRGGRGQRRGGPRRRGPAGRHRGGRGGRDRRQRPDPLRARRGRPRPSPGRPHRRAGLQPRHAARRPGRDHDRPGGRAGGDRRLDPAQGRHRPEAGPEHAQHRDHGPARQDLRQPDGRPAGDERQAAPPRGGDRVRGDGDRRGRGGGAAAGGRRRGEDRHRGRPGRRRSGHRPGAPGGEGWVGPRRPRGGGSM